MTELVTTNFKYQFTRIIAHAYAYVDVYAPTFNGKWRLVDEGVIQLPKLYRETGIDLRKTRGILCEEDEYVIRVKNKIEIL